MIGTRKAAISEQDVDEAMTAMLASGEIVIAGQNTAGEDLFQPSAKAVVRAICKHLQSAVSQADHLGRNFTHAEQRDLLIQVRQLYQALASAEEAEA
ncbi:MAG: hypothetical protein ACRDHW_02765 [Ktedonobacteraceae bacterium]